ncbi:hypothetical protein JKI95_03035 [Corynebacterium aquatimens]|uniref:hypothetical protein n=1 Tax=Corynebacterium TaxID=1716 RepID=UPI001F33228B|nr:MULTISPECIES: hypothetical protein [Corynebacterium]QYH20025.1 hypothetical protein JKI95_03035 [Corynebacterium aquatimens]UIZ92777.1 hypothetical protein JZY91_03140 [Corynebacterium sp. CNCTC7651]
MPFIAYELFYRTADSIADDGEKVAIIVHDITTQEVDVALAKPGTPSAPKWFGDEHAERVIEQLQAILQGKDDHTIEINDPTDPAFTLRRGAPFEAEDLSTATYAIANDSGETKLFLAFIIEFRPNLRLPNWFPVAVFVYDPRVSRLVSHVYGPENPLAPRGYDRRQQKIVGKRLDQLFKQIATAHMDPSPGVITPFKNMGPQFRSMGIPSIDAPHIHDALDQAVEMVEEFAGQQAS